MGVLIAALVALTAGGLADRQHTRRVSAQASSDSWWCAHKGVRCRSFDEAAYHVRWERREHGYAAGDIVLAAMIVVVGSRRLRLRL